MTTDTLKTPPNNLEAERGVLGGILRDPDALADVQGFLAPVHFSTDAHQKLYGALCDLIATGSAVDLVLLHDALQRKRWLLEVGGAKYLADLFAAVPTGANVRYHAELVRDAAIVRGIIHASNENLRDAYDRTQSADDFAAAAENRILAVVDGTAPAREATEAPQLAREFLVRLDERASGTKLNGYQTGFKDLDVTLSGIHPGQLVILGARPGAGKTAFALSLALTLTGSGVPTLLFSLEMPAAEIMDRAASVRSGVWLSKIRAGRLNSEDVERVYSAASQLATEPLLIDDSCDLTAAKLGAAVRRAVRRRGVRAVVVDYLQLLSPENPKDNRTQQVGLMARRAKMLARTCGIPVLMLSQLNREMDNRPDGRPRLSDLRESGEIEQHADAVIFLAPQKADDAEEVWPVDVIVAKNRNGPVGDTTLSYRRPNTRFENRI
jgi:replicative DNA helicase